MNRNEFPLLAIFVANGAKRLQHNAGFNRNQEIGLENLLGVKNEGKAKRKFGSVRSIQGILDSFPRLIRKN
jgi:hypothetical protein